MSHYVLTRRTDGRVLWMLCALLFGAGFVLLLGIGVVIMLASLTWAGYLAYTRTPGVSFAAGTLAIVAIALLAAWGIF